MNLEVKRDLGNLKKKFVAITNNSQVDLETCDLEKNSLLSASGLSRENKIKLKQQRGETYNIGKAEAGN